MNKEYINKSRYDKNRKQRISSKVSISKAPKKPITHKKKSDKTLAQKTSFTSKKKNIVLKLLFVFFIIIVIAISIRLISKEKNDSILPFFTSKQIENNSKIVIADYGLKNLTTTSSNNVVISELEQYIYPMLLTTNIDYSITYEVIESIDKVSNIEYLLHINPGYNINSTVVKDNLKKHISSNTKYSFKTKNIQDIIVEDNKTLKIVLKKSDPLFIYNLNIPIYTFSSNDYKEYNINDSNNNSLVLNRNINSDVSIPKQITIQNVSDLSMAVDLYNNDKIDIFFSSYLNVENLLGKSSFNIDKINSGQSVFLLGNPTSDLFIRDEIRKAIAYGINKEEIASSAANKSAIIIDTPYIYDNKKYKYDIYAAENMLLSNGYKKNYGVYQKYENGNRIYLELTLIVNKNSKEKLIAAGIIKKNLQDVGIKIMIKELNDKDIITTINAKTYDLILADINLNESPDISFIYENIRFNKNINSKIDILSDSKIANLKQNLNNLITSVSEEFPIIGLYSKPVYIISKKDITLFKNARFYNMFNSLRKRD